MYGHTPRKIKGNSYCHGNGHALKGGHFEEAHCGMAARNTPKANTSAKSPNKTLNDDAEAPLPSVNERLAQLRPSRELLEYYRLKMAEFDDEYDALTERLEQYKCTYEDQVSRMQCSM